MHDALKLFAVVAVLLLGTRSVAWGEGPRPGSKVFPYAVSTTTLPNGLSVVAVPFDSPGLVAYWTVVRAGSRNEIEPGRSGFAHFFEHMMFRGTERHPKERYNAILKELGADHNAFTTDDYTAYHILGPATALETMMSIEADRFMNLKYSVEDFKKEAGAVLGEYNKNASHPFLTMHETLRDAAFTTHTYRHTTIGFLKDVRDMPNQYEYSLQFFDRYYRPENCILLVVGDVEAKALFEKAARHYGGWKKGSHRFTVPAEPEQKKEKRVEAVWPTPTQPYLFAGYHGPAFSTSAIDLPALDLLAQLIFAEAAPLYQRLVVDEQVADILAGGAADHRDPYLFTILARVKRPEDLGRVESAIAQAIEELKAGEVPKDRLERVKSHLKYSYAMGLDTAGSVARSLAHYLALTGDPDSVNRLYALYERVTAEDVRSAARRYLTPDNRTTVTLRHAPAPDGGVAADEETGAEERGAAAAEGSGGGLR